MNRTENHFEAEHNAKRTDHASAFSTQGRVTIVFAAFIIMLAGAIEMYELVHRPQEIIYLAIFGIVILVALYVLISAIIKEIEQTRRVRQKQIEEMEKAEKANYLLMKKGLRELEEKIARMEKLMGAMGKELNNAQKSIAKVQINRGKENAKEILAASEKLLQELERMSAAPRPAAPIIQPVPKPEPIPEPIPEPVYEVPEEEEEVDETDYYMLDDSESEAAPIELEFPDEPGPVDEEIMIGAPEPEPEMVIEPAVEAEPILEPIPEPIPEPEPEPIPEPEPVPAAEEKPSMPDLSDPNHVMTPDEIAALLANM
jgi:hypothetical protein